LDEPRRDLAGGELELESDSNALLEPYDFLETTSLEDFDLCDDFDEVLEMEFLEASAPLKCEIEDFDLREIDDAFEAAEALEAAEAFEATNDLEEDLDEIDALEDTATCFS